MLPHNGSYAAGKAAADVCLHAEGGLATGGAAGALDLGEQVVAEEDLGLADLNLGGGGGLGRGGEEGSG